MANNGTSSGHYLVEMDGVNVIEASEVSGIGVKHDPFKISVGNRSKPRLGRSKSECNEVTIKQAHALNNVGSEMFSWFDDYINGLRTDKPTMRLIQLDEDGFSEVAVWHMLECVPTEFSQESNKGDSNDGAYFMLKMKPTDCWMD